MAAEHSERLTAKEGRKFALTLAAAFAVVSLLAHWRGRPLASGVAWIVALIFIFLALVLPQRLGPIEAGWTKLGLAMSRITSPLFLGILYFVVFTPIAWLRRKLGKNPIHRTPIGGSYWITRAPTDAESQVKGMERQF